EALPCERIGAVRIAQAVSWIECELQDMPVYGDHQLFVGRTLIAQTAGGAPLLMEGRSAFGRFEADEA
ncbi:MAG: flavin reductase, partial [Coriobacteriales bacterium]